MKCRFSGPFGGQFVAVHGWPVHVSRCTNCHHFGTTRTIGVMRYPVSDQLAEFGWIDEIRSRPVG